MTTNELEQQCADAEESGSLATRNVEKFREAVKDNEESIKVAEKHLTDLQRKQWNYKEIMPLVDEMAKALEEYRQIAFNALNALAEIEKADDPASRPPDCGGCACHISPPCSHCVEGHDGRS